MFYCPEAFFLTPFYFFKCSIFVSHFCIVSFNLSFYHFSNTLSSPSLSLWKGYNTCILRCAECISYRNRNQNTITSLSLGIQHHNRTSGYLIFILVWYLFDRISVHTSNLFDTKLLMVWQHLDRVLLNMLEELSIHQKLLQKIWL